MTAAGRTCGEAEKYALVCASAFKYAGLEERRADSMSEMFAIQTAVNILKLVCAPT